MLFHLTVVAKLPSIDDCLLKNCALGITNVFGAIKIVKKFESLPLANQMLFIQEKSKKPLMLIEKSNFFSLPG